VKAADFDFSKQLKFSPDSGITSFGDNRLVIFDANAVGLLRQQVVERYGIGEARHFFLRFGYTNGYADFMQMKINFDFDSEADLLGSGPTIHTWEGIVHAKPGALRFDRASGDFDFTGVWSNSYEAEQHLSYNPPGDEPVCWSAMGYASGWATAFFGQKLVAIEPVCVGKGDDHCEWRIQPVGRWGDVAQPYVEAFEGIGDL
jgi:hypothetical protein